MRLFQVRSAKLKQRSSAPRFLRSNVHRWDFASLSPWSWRSCARWRGPSARRRWASALRRSAARSLTRSAGSRPRLSKCLRSRSNWSVSHLFYSRHFAIFKSYHIISIVHHDLGERVQRCAGDWMQVAQSLEASCSEHNWVQVLLFLSRKNIYISCFFHFIENRRC